MELNGYTHLILEMTTKKELAIVRVIDKIQAMQKGKMSRVTLVFVICLLA